MAAGLQTGMGFVCLARFQHLELTGVAKQVYFFP